MEALGRRVCFLLRSRKKWFLLTTIPRLGPATSKGNQEGSRGNAFSTDTPIESANKKPALVSLLGCDPGSRTASPILPACSPGIRGMTFPRQVDLVFSVLRAVCPGDWRHYWRAAAGAADWGELLSVEEALCHLHL